MSHSERGLGPPKEVGPDKVRATPTTTPSEVDTEKPSSAPPRQCHADTVAGLHRRRQASWRLLPLDCGCRDSWTFRCQDEPEPSERMVDAYSDAVIQLRDAGLTPAAFLPEMRVMWRRGGRDRQLVSAIAQRWEAA